MKLKTTIKFFSSVAERKFTNCKKPFNDNVLLNQVYQNMQKEVLKEKQKIDSLPDIQKPKAADKKEVNKVLEDTKNIQINFSAY